MTGSFTTKETKRYCYYLCSAAHKRGRQSCPSKSIPAGPIERLVLEQIAKLVPKRDGAEAEPFSLTLTPPEQVRLVQLLVERADYDGAKGKVSMTFRPEGIQTLAEERAGQTEEPTP
jgi:hypothetical protein